MSVKTVDPKVLQRWLNEGGATLVDVREAVECKTPELPGAAGAAGRGIHERRTRSCRQEARHSLPVRQAR